MIQVTYIGPLPNLKGKTALAKEVGELGKISVQFDDKRLTLSGGPIPQELAYEPHARFPTLQDFDNPPADGLGYGWHLFPREDFEP